MKKRIICLLISFSLLLVTFTGAISEEVKINFTFQDDGTDIRFLTSLLPEHKLPVIPPPEGMESKDVFALLQPDLLPALIRGFGETITEWNKEKASTEKGFFVGDLFEHAGEKEVIDINANDTEILISRLAGHLAETETGGQDEAAAAKRAENISSALKFLEKQIAGEETTARISTFDKNRYFTIDIQNHQETVLSLSADLSQKDTVCLLICRGAGDAVYYEEINCVSHEAETDYTISLYRTEAPSFRIIKEQECMQFSEIRFNKKSEDTFDFEGEIQSVLLPSAAKINGGKSIDEDGKGTISVDMAYDEQNQGIPGMMIKILDSIF